MTEQDYTYPVPERNREGTPLNADTYAEFHRGNKQHLSLEAARALAEAAAAAEQGAAEYASEGIDALSQWLELVAVESKNLQAMRKAELEPMTQKSKSDFDLAA